jgi:hypothetical protein
MTQLQLSTDGAMRRPTVDVQACQETLARALRCRMIIQNVHGGGGGDSRCRAATIGKRLAELDRQIAEAREQLAASGVWH